MIDAKTRDFYVGLFVLSAIGVIIATFVRTGRIQSSDRIPIFMRTEVANGLTPDTKVYLQGLEVGRLREVVPAIDPQTNELNFVSALDINVAFEDGTPLVLPVGTEAKIAKPSPIAPPILELTVPAGGVAGGVLSPGDTINSIRPEDVLSSLTKVLPDITEQLLRTIEEVQTLLSAGTDAVTEVKDQVASTTPRIDSILERVADNLAATEQLIADATPRVDVIQDSVLGAIFSARQTIEGFDSLRISIQNLAVDNQESVREIVSQMARTAIILGHFADQLSRRPTRILTGITPPPEADSVVNH